MSTSAHDEWFKPPLAERRTIGLVEPYEAAIGFLTLVGFIFVTVGVSSLFVLGAFYLKSL